MRGPGRHGLPSTADAGRPGGAAALARAAPWALREPLQGRRQATRRRHRSGTGQASGRSTGAPLRVGLNDRPCLVVSSSSPATAPLGRWPLPRRVTSATGSGETSPSSHPLFHGCSPGPPSLRLPLLVRGLKKTTGFLEFVQTRPEHSHTLFQALHCVFGF